MPIVRVALGKEFFQMFHRFNDSGYQADVKGRPCPVPNGSSGRMRTGGARRAGRASAR